MPPINTEDAVTEPTVFIGTPQYGVPGPHHSFSEITCI